MALGLGGGINLGSAYGEIRIGTGEARENIRGLAGAVRGVRKSLGAGLKVAAGAAGGAIAVLSLAFRDSASLAREQINAEKQLAAVIKSTGGVAGVTADAAKDLAASLQEVTNFGDEAVIGAENLLLTFTNIGKNVFPRATETVLDMSQSLGQDLKSSAIQLGKALNDPITGVTALRRVGVSFTEQQREQIKTMVEAGDIAGAQKIILAELAKEFGGSARAAADPAIQLKNSWGDFKEVLGMGVLPIVNNAARRAMPRLKDAAERLGEAIQIVTTDGISVRSAVNGIAYALGISKEKAEPFANTLENVKRQLSGLVSTGQQLITPLAEFVSANVEAKDILLGVGAAIAVVVVPALLGIGAATAPVIGAFALMVGGAALLRRAWESDFGGIQGKTKSVGQFILGIIKQVTSLGTQWWGTYGKDVSTIVAQLWTLVGGIFQGGGNKVSGILRTLGAYWNRTLGRTFRIAGELVAAFAAAITGDWDGLGEHLRNAWNALWSQIGDALGTSTGLIVKGVMALIRTIKDSFTGQADWGALGRAIVHGIVAGASALGGMLADAARSLAGSFLSSFKSAMGIRSPSRLMAEMGRLSMEGFAQGIDRYALQPVRAASRVAGQVVQASKVNSPLSSQQRLAPVAAGASSGRWEINITVNVPGGDPRDVAQSTEIGILRAARALGLQ